MSLGVVLLAAGHGSRMKSKKQKILHEVGGKPMFMHVFEAAEALADVRPVLVVAPGEEGVPNLLGERALYALQAERLGTGHATMMATATLQGQSDQVLVTYGDMPLLRAETMRRLAALQVESGAAISLLSVMGEPGSSFGRVVRDEAGEVVEIVEAANARHRPNAAELLAIRELNGGIYCFDAAFLWENLPRLPIRQARSGQEYYLTDMVELAVNAGKKVVAHIVEDPDECLGAGTRAEMVDVERAFQRRTNRHWLERGVTLQDPINTFIDSTVMIGQDTIIRPNTFLQGQTVIGDDCVIGPMVVLQDCTVAAGTTVPPFTHEQGRNW